MGDVVAAYEIPIRLGAFGVVFALMAIWELLRPRREQAIPRARRWPGNLGVVAIDTVLVRLLFPMTAVGLALMAEARGWGLFNALALPGWIAIAGSVMILDLAIYLQHVLFHAVPALWRLHRMHHADVDIDVTTAIRFHPIEIALSMLWKIGWVLALGVPPFAVLVFEIILNGCAMFNHANVKLPLGLDRALRLFLVTPDMHRVHHSIIRREHDSNYGFNLSVWDRMFGTYTPQPREGHEGMTIGLAAYQSEKPTELLWSLAIPMEPLAPDAPATAPSRGSPKGPGAA